MAPLSGLHLESLLAAEEQLALLTPLLLGRTLPADVALLDGSFADWVEDWMGPEVGRLGGWGELG